MTFLRYSIADKSKCNGSAPAIKLLNTQLFFFPFMLRSSQRLLQNFRHITPIQASLRKMSSSLYTDETPAAVKEAKVKIVE